jgi:hypothetical protein
VKIQILLSKLRRLFTCTAQGTATASTTLGQARSIVQLLELEPDGTDLLFMGPTRVCACGNEVFHALIWFNEEREIGGYFTEMACAFCGSIVRGVTPVDEEVFND